ncbi:MAG TPA: regulatory protein RecX, partial [Alphaproteobacteria bacterium]|nr:regulatory protein RecX [Alphaproteobacteria bacterium]
TCYRMLDDLVSKFTSLGYLNDAAYASGLIYSLTQRGLSRQRILYSLKLKGLSDECIEAAMPDADAGHEFLMAVRFCKKKKIGPYSLRADDEARSLSSLARGGFSYDLARRAILLDKDEAEELLAGL